MSKFEELGLSQEILSVLNHAGFKEPSEIQEKTIPLALAGRDIIGGSATGSGKTLAFASPILENLIPNHHVQALILTPTRELAEQVADSIRNFGRNKKLKVLAIYGGTNIDTQIRRIPSTDVIVATPGRILDHLNRRTLNLNQVKFLVLDEVDRMFDMGFYKDVELILKQCPEKRQTMLFSATISADIDHLSKKYTKNAVEVSVNSYVDNSKLKQIYYNIESNMKFSLLVHLLKKEKDHLVMVFCGTRRNTDIVTANLNRIGIAAKAIHGGLSQNKRIKTLDEFHKEDLNVLVCTDVAARGLDIKSVSHVYNYDLPNEAKDYIHRIGRTARAGKEGIAVTLLSSRDYEVFNQIINDPSLHIVEESLPEFSKVRIFTDFERKRPTHRGTNFRQRGRFNRNRREPRNRERSGSRDSRPNRSRFSQSRNFNRGRR